MVDWGFHRAKELHMMHRIAGQAPHPHATVAEARRCQDNYELAEETREIQAQERADDERAYASKAARDDAVASLDAFGEAQDACRGGVCQSILQQCSKHSALHQARYGRAGNE
jgi:hypothetical protein